MQLACVHIPILPLQLLWRTTPELRHVPLVVVSEDKPQGRVTWACERARQAGVLPGQRYSYALSLCPQLHARTIDDAILTQAMHEVSAALHEVAPRVALGPPGALWLDGDALTMYATAQAWAAAIVRVMHAARFEAVVVVGTSQLLTLAIARVRPVGPHVVPAEVEQQEAWAVPLARLDVKARERDALARLGVFTLGQLVALPAHGVRHRFGAEVHTLLTLAQGAWQPFAAAPPPETIEETWWLDDDEHDVTRLLFGIKACLDRLLARLEARAIAVTTLHVELGLRHGTHYVPHQLSLTPAVPTLQARTLLQLVQLRLTATALPAGAPQGYSFARLSAHAHSVRAVRMWADGERATREQLALFARAPKRSLVAANDALAKIRAELGDAAVVRAALRPGHLPEARFAFEPLQKLPEARPASTPVAITPMIRRVWQRPLVLPGTEGETRNDGWLLAGLEVGPVTALTGPFVLSGGWWVRPIAREYHFAEMRRGDWLWIFYDRMRKRWLCQGEVA